MFYKWHRGHTQLFWDVKDQGERQQKLDYLFTSLFGKTRNGTFVEVGASNGIDCGIMTPLADLGWKGLCVEPNKKSAYICMRNHEYNQGVKVVNKAAGAEKKTVSVFGEGHGATVNSEYVEASKQISWTAQMTKSNEVMQDKLDTILIEEGFAPGNIDVMSIDVEGHEIEVFKGFDLAKWKPKMLMVEMADVHPDFKKFPETVAKYQNLREQILNTGYKQLHQDICNTVFIRRD